MAAMKMYAETEVNMPYCPKCKYKYVEGKTICPDCECELVDELDNDTNTSEDAFSNDNSGEDFISNSGKQYITKSDKYKDLHSSSLSLIIVGVLGDIFLILNALDVLPIHFAFEGLSGILFYIVMGTLLNVFLIGGIVSLKSAGKIKSEIKSEEDFTSSVISYITDTYTKNSIDEHFSSTDEANLYFEREAFIKKAISDKFGELDEAYLDKLIEDIYQQIFE